MKNNLILRYLAVVLFVQIACIQYISQYTNIIETYYSNGLYVYISKFFRLFLGWISFSIGDILYLLIIVLILRQSYLLIKYRFIELKSYLIYILAMLSLLYFLFYFNWGLNYYRIPLVDKLGIKRSNPATVIT